VAGADDLSHWSRWHQDYDDPDSSLSRRLAVVTTRVREVLDAAPAGSIRLVSACAGQGRDVVGALRSHPRREDVAGSLVESDPALAADARRALGDAGLRSLRVVTSDAGLVASYAGAIPANVVLLCGVFGNISDADVENTVRNASALCAPDAYVVWTRHRRYPDLTPAVRRWFTASGFEEIGFDSPADTTFGVGTNRLRSEPAASDGDQRLFTFL
jgi:hypothetical protein